MAAKKTAKSPAKKTAKKATKSTAKKSTQKRTGTTGKFTADERAAMRERAKELKAEATKADGEKTLLAKVAEMKGNDRAMAERLHAMITEAAPSLAPKTWYGMPPGPRTARSFASSKARPNSAPDTQRLASATKPISTRAPCGRLHTH